MGTNVILQLLLLSSSSLLFFHFFFIRGMYSYFPSFNNINTKCPSRNRRKQLLAPFKLAHSYCRSRFQPLKYFIYLFIYFVCSFSRMHSLFAYIYPSCSQMKHVKTLINTIRKYYNGVVCVANAFLVFTFARKKLCSIRVC